MNNIYYGTATTPTDDYLAYYGIKGMKWGVRRYLDSNRKMTDSAKERYGHRSVKDSSARKIQRDFNQLDQSRANNAANAFYAQSQLNHYKTRINKKTDKYMKKHPDQKREAVSNLYTGKYQKRIDKNSNLLKESTDNIRAIGDLQNKVIERAKKNDYNIKLLSGTRRVASKGDRKVNALSTLGMLGGVYYNQSTVVPGTYARIKKKKNRS